jgi:release factor glutamine methyltransferase
MVYRPTLPPDRVEDLSRWHEHAYRDLAAAGERRLGYLGLDLVVPPGVFAPTPTSDLLGRAVLAEMRAAERVLDMGTGSGVNALLAARAGASVLGVDVNPAAVEAARANAIRNGVQATFRVSDVFAQVDGLFDLMIIDPPFRWFAPRDMAEVAITDQGYATIGRFLAGVRERLNPGGRVLMFFGTSGDQDHILGLARRGGLHVETVASRGLERDGVSVTYSTFRMRPMPFAAGRV